MNNVICNSVLSQCGSTEGDTKEKTGSERPDLPEILHICLENLQTDELFACPMCAV